jgi:hypothetical protein
MLMRQSVPVAPLARQECLSASRWIALLVWLQYSYAYCIGIFRYVNSKVISDPSAHRRACLAKKTRRSTTNAARIGPPFFFSFLKNLPGILNSKQVTNKKEEQQRRCSITLINSG